MTTIVFIGGCSFEFNLGPTYEKFEVTYTSNLEFLVGEEWKDELIKGTGTKKDDTKEDVTSIMTIDKSEYKKDTPGKYKIYFKLEEITLDYEVSVVEKITDETAINVRLNPVISNSFKRTDNVLKFEASNTTAYDGFNFTEKLIYEDNNGEYSVYYNWEIDEDTICEVWYIGTLTEGKMIFKEYGIQNENFHYSTYQTNQYSDLFFSKTKEQITVKTIPNVDNALISSPFVILFHINIAYILVEFKFIDEL